MRKRIDLSGEWDFKIDPLNIGEKQKWTTGFEPETKVSVPHIWQTDKAYLNYKGTAWYQRNIDEESIPLENDLFICFQAVDFQAHVWWNGELLGFNEGGFTPFEFAVPKGLINKNNQIVVRVYDPADNAEIPIGKQGSWYTRVSGIWQTVFLEERPEVFISAIFATPDFDRETLEIVIELQGEFEVGQEKLMEYTIRSHSLGEDDWESDKTYSGIILARKDSSTEKLTIKKEILVEGIEHWSPATPYLYEIELKLKGNKEDIFSVVFGFRKVEQKDGKVFLNNEEVFIRGALDQAFYPETIYTAPSTEYIINEIKSAKKMGFNLLRKHIKVEMPNYLYWADRMGMLIWAEPPNYVKWTPLARERFLIGLKNMIIRDYNHPSIIIWSVYNEEWGLEWGLDFDKQKQEHVNSSFEKVKEWDTTRLVCDNSGWSHVNTDINDYHRYFVLPDQQKEWKEDLDNFIISNPDANFVPGYHSNNEPKIVSEFGVWGLPDVNKLKEFYQGTEPWWFINQGEETHQDDYKKPFTLFQNFERFGISKALGSYEQLAVLSQKRMVRAVKSVIEEMRKRPAIAGYVVTEFTDIEWETNGWLDFMRQPKEGFEKMIDFNGPNGIFIEVPRHNFWIGENVSVDVYIQTEKLLVKELLIKWCVVNESGEHILSGECKAGLSGMNTFLQKAIKFSVPNIAEADFYSLKVELWEQDKKLTENEEELTFSPLLKAHQEIVYIDVLDDEFKSAVEMAGFITTQERADSSVVLTDTLSENDLRYASQGGKVIFLADRGDMIREKGDFTFRKLDTGESWSRASSMNYLDKEWFGDLPLKTEMGWEFENLLPDYVVPFTDYKKVNNNRIIHMFGNPALAEHVDVISGYFQGWLGQNGGTFLDQSYGSGRIITTTWKLNSETFSSPIAQQILNHMIYKLSSVSEESVEVPNRDNQHAVQVGTFDKK
ncbi:glycoside hydrolase family 2 TIM barrel-domain containing protein [Planococcus shenhongbingii]|uniref:glycoside hydrolase family 2 protein n=1 Tax=Planococcus shenhongbingii TaxID=3058398 RepID=UPI00260813E4|nr:sugar-binding domain-containing protein [Planococcus sp. N016]WKA60345.1 glycoside hydrolase family 2 TIM barrel-domain containing protein [Planococcus sp. N016]